MRPSIHSCVLFVVLRSLVVIVVMMVAAWVLSAGPTSRRHIWHRTILWSLFIGDYYQCGWGRLVDYCSPELLSLCLGVLRSVLKHQYWQWDAALHPCSIMILVILFAIHITTIDIIIFTCPLTQRDTHSNANTWAHVFRQCPTSLRTQTFVSQWIHVRYHFINNDTAIIISIIILCYLLPLIFRHKIQI